MISLTFDVEAAKDQLTEVFNDRLDAQGSVYNLLNVDIEEVTFADVAHPLPNQAALVADMKADLKNAQAHSQTWFNELQPQLTVIPQAYINHAALWNNAIPMVLKQLGASAPDRALLLQLFQGLKQSVDTQLDTLGSLSTALSALRDTVKADAANFSAKHGPFQQLESLDKDNMAAVRAELDKIKKIISEYNQRIHEDDIKAQRDLAIASNAIKYGGKLGKPGKILGLTIGLIFIVSATMSIDDMLSTIDLRLSEAEKEGEYQLELTLLSAQLMALETASSALADNARELDDLIASLQSTIKIWQQEGRSLAEVISGLQGDEPVHSFVNLFDLGRSQEQWDEMNVFAGKWQTAEVVAKTSNQLILGGNVA